MDEKKIDYVKPKILDLGPVVTGDDDGDIHNGVDGFSYWVGLW